MISVIIPCRNRIDTVSVCIDSVLLASRKMYSVYPDSSVEVIVVNDNSEQDFPEILSSRYPTIKIINSPGVGPGVARNYGFNTCGGEYIFFTDSDCIVSEDWLVDGYNFFKKYPDGIIQGNPYLFQQNTNVDLAKNEGLLYELMFSSYVKAPYVLMTDSRNLLIKKQNIKSLGEKIFSEDLSKASAESRVFGLNCLRHNIKIYWGEHIKIYHEDPRDMEYVCKQKYRHGLGRTKIWDTTPDFDALKARYFDRPIAYGIDIEYVSLAHFSFLYGYFSNIDNEDLLSHFMCFIKKIFAQYGVPQKKYEHVLEILKNG